MWQEIAIIATGILAIAYTGYKIRRLFTTKQAKRSCPGCTGCITSPKHGKYPTENSAKSFFEVLW